ncbi:MAG TPA: sigma-70 family RNA polymerase sigma factor [Ktedonobacterales bacterium]|nr:sigma-70 family RNA polymerase sigma factor [Ktedonobacterales bacterium]
MNLGGVFDRMPFNLDASEPQAGAVSLPAAAVSLSGAPGAATLTESELIARARTGDQDAFAGLVRLHQRHVYLLALRMLHNEDDASEATQEVFLAAWQGLRGFRGEAQLATWLYRIAYNHCLKAAEARRRDAQARSELATASAHAARPAVKLSQMHAQTALRDLCDTVRMEIACLPPKYQAVLSLRHLQELSYEEIAEVLRVPIGTVKTHLFRARAILKERLADLDRAASGGLSRAGELGAGIQEFIGRRLDGLWREDAR